MTEYGHDLVSFEEAQVLPWMSGVQEFLDVIAEMISPKLGEG